MSINILGTQSFFLGTDGNRNQRMVSAPFDAHFVNKKLIFTEKIPIIEYSLFNLVNIRPSLLTI